MDYDHSAELCDSIVKELGLSDAQPDYVMGSAYRFGVPALQIQFNLARAVAFFERGATKNSISCVRALGLMYHRGECEGEDILLAPQADRARRWYESGASLGDPVCLNNLGLLLLEESASEHLDQARALFAQSADLGFLQAVLNYLDISQDDPDCAAQCRHYKGFLLGWN